MIFLRLTICHSIVIYLFRFSLLALKTHSSYTFTSIEENNERIKTKGTEEPKSKATEINKHTRSKKLNNVRFAVGKFSRIHKDKLWRR